MYLTSDTVYKFSAYLCAAYAITFAFFAIRCGLYNLTIDYVRASICGLVSGFAYAVMYVARKYC